MLASSPTIKSLNTKVTALIHSNKGSHFASPNRNGSHNKTRKNITDFKAFSSSNNDPELEMKPPATVLVKSQKVKKNSSRHRRFKMEETKVGKCVIIDLKFANEIFKEEKAEKECRVTRCQLGRCLPHRH